MVDSDMELIRRLDALAARQPEVVAHRSGSTSLTHGELHERSQRLAAWLQGHVPPGTPVALYGHKEPAMLVGFVGAMRAGVPYIPLDVEIPPARVQRVRDLAGVQVLLTLPGYRRDHAHPVRRPPQGTGRRPRRSRVLHVHQWQHRGPEGRDHHPALPADVRPRDDRHAGRPQPGGG